MIGKLEVDDLNDAILKARECPETIKTAEVQVLVVIHRLLSIWLVFSVSLSVFL